MSAGHLILAYHGCDITTRDDLVSGRLTRLAHSDNRYDWLGPGAYFFEADPMRAKQFADRAHMAPHKRYSARPIATPAVVGALLTVNNGLDLTTQDGIDEFSEAAEEFRFTMMANHAEMPRNVSADAADKDIIYRALDRAVIAYLHQRRAAQHQQPYEIVRGAFMQGEPVIEGSAFCRGTHIQIALRSDECAVAWFLPQGQKLLSVSDYDQAKRRLKEMTTAGKPRIRAVS